MQDPMEALSHFHNYMTAQVPSQATFDYVREQRRVNSGTRDHVDELLANDNWRKPWHARALEFCNDLLPGTGLAADDPPNAGLERMIRDNAMQELVTGMQEFKMHASTQESCIRQLHIMLIPTIVPGVLNPHQMHYPTYVTTARATPGLFRCIISTVRAHPTNMTIQLRGSALLSTLMPITTGQHDMTYVTRPLADYTIATLIANVHLNMDSPALARICLVVLCTLVDMHSSATGVASPPFLMSGVHSIPGFVMTAMHLHQDCDTLVWRSMRLLRLLLQNSELPENTAGLLAFNVIQAEEYILASMARLIPYARAETVCLDVLTMLYQKFPLRVKRPTDVMARAQQNLMAHSDNPDVRDSALTLMSTVVEGFWSRTAPMRELEDGQIRPCVSAIMPLVVCSLRVADAFDPLSKCNCIAAFNMLSTLCERDAGQISLVIEMQLLQLLQYKYHAPVEHVVDGRWMAAYFHLANILTWR